MKNNYLLTSLLGLTLFVAINLSVSAQCPDLVCRKIAITNISGIDFSYSFEIENIGNDTIFLNKVAFQNYVSPDSSKSRYYAAGGAFIAYYSTAYLLPGQTYRDVYHGNSGFATEPCPFLVVDVSYEGKAECNITNNTLIKRITLETPVDAQFVADITTGTAPLTVHFTDQSTGKPTEWGWDFNNDKTVDSTSQNPTFIYKTPGTYAVRLLSSKVGAKDSIIKTAYIVVNKQTSGIKNTEDEGWSVYPNPSNGPVHIILEDKFRNQQITIRAFDESGKMVYAAKSTDKTNLTLDFTGFLPGIYVVEIMGEKEVFTKKVVIKK